ncbi:hypothetical protein E5Q_05963 [Mixia osmundae IAM 14324]|uniref:Anaphase-promoting complex subunit 4 WD40 domain-containing protein n=1 Tax=Mixia osmundae (strain CBS 9802 / IAM 14324 / JCM 22182 / KY 12970) TaxID=764103 RepID=G7E9F0_MIXOS|nr:hypothetical protein E5Q_05963 [Mixia osmundae IAM 14324]
MDIEERPRKVRRLAPAPDCIAGQLVSKARLGRSGTYVLELAAFDSTFAAAGSDKSIRTYDSATLKQLNAIQGKANVTSLTGSVWPAPVLCMTSDQGDAVLYDLRTGAPGGNLSLKSARPGAYTCGAFDSHQTQIAAGTELALHEAHIDIWDLRAAAVVHTYTESHSDDITCVRYHPHRRHQLFSGSTDTLWTCFDTRLSDEDDAVIATGNEGAPLRSMSMLQERLACLTTQETISIWDLAECEVLDELGDVRGQTEQGWQSHHVIRADVTADAVQTWLGTESGEFVVARQSVDEPDAVLATFSGSHSDIVRCIHHDVASDRVKLQSTIRHIEDALLMY